MSLNLNDRTFTSPGRYHTSAKYTEAVNDSRFVRLFGIAVLVTSVVGYFIGPVNIGVGFAILGFGASTYYRGLGLASIITSFMSPILGSTMMCLGIGYKGGDVLRTLAKEGKGDPDWQETRTRAITGIVLSAIGLLINAAWLVLSLIQLILLVNKDTWN